MTSSWRLLTHWEARTDLVPYGALLLRLSLALYWGVHWEYKVFHDGMKVTEAVFTTLGFPSWLAWADVIFELIAVVALFFGLYVRTISVLRLVILLPALKLWIPNGLWAFHGGYEFPVMWILMQLSQCLLGAGAFNAGWIAGRLKPLRHR